MNFKKFLFSALFIGFTTITYAAPGDTITVQTIDFNTPVLPGWNAPRSGTYLFPPDSLSFSKILISYTLKCDPDQNPHCGEWDYITYLKYIEHTGAYDSNLYFHPNYLVNDQSPDSFPYMNDTSWRYQPVLEYFNNTNPTYEAEIGTAAATLTLPLEDTTPDGRFQAIYNASDLQVAGIQSGQLTGLKINVLSGSVFLRHFTVKLKNSNGPLTTDTIQSAGFQTVFSRNIALTNGWNNLPFSTPFNWDGSSDILMDFSYANHKGSAVMQADTVSANAALMSKAKENYLDFEGWDYVTVPAGAFATIDSCITISFWQYGNPALQPLNSSILEGIDSAGNRVLNVHLPWGNKKVYWDAGKDGSDRISRTANNTALWEGKWNHWVFMKDARTSGIMRIFHNGQLWFQQSGKHKLMNGIAKFRLGGAFTYDGYYAGMIDEFRVWDTVLDWNDLSAWMYRDLDSTHPSYSHLRAYYQFDKGKGQTVRDHSPNGFDGTLFGMPEWKNYQGEKRFRNATLMSARLHLSLQNGVYDASLLDSLVVVDTFAQGAVDIVRYDSAAPRVPVDTLLKWPSYYNNYTYDAAGQAIDSTYVPNDEILYHHDLPYYGAPYEVTHPWEIGRFITPYGNGLDLGNGFTWIYDVTDYAPFLHDSVQLTAGNFQELLNMKFIMIEGTPPRNVKKIEKVYSGSYSLNNFLTLVAPDTLSLLPDATAFKLKIRTSGHQFDNPDNCAEFCNRIHSIDVNNQQIAQWQIIQECSSNPLYPQGGTWIYDRAGWCPGMKVTERDFDITPYITGNDVIIDYNSQPSEWGNYVLEAQLISYGPPNFNDDAAITEIIAPNNLKRYGRTNPTATAPLVVLQNLGGDTLKSADIVYGPANATAKTFHWTGNLPMMDTVHLHLESFRRDAWEAANGHFNVRVENPNNGTDENSINDARSSTFDLPPVFPTTFVVYFKTNKTAYQNSYEFRDRFGNQIYEKHDFNNTTLYQDTVTFVDGTYDFYLWDSHDNGISFWANNEGTGYLKFYDMNGDIIKSFNGDFGHNIYQCFFADATVGYPEHHSDKLAFSILPNPNKGTFTISYGLKMKGSMEISIVNISGKPVFRQKIMAETHGNLPIRLNKVPSGVYSITITSNGVRESKKLIVRRAD